MRSITHPPRLDSSRASHRRIAQIFTVSIFAIAGLAMFAPSASAETTHVLALARTLDDVLNNIRNYIMGISALLATVFLTLGGVRYVLANGDPGETEKAKQAFKSAGLGYALTALAPLVVAILRGIVGA
jgi:hypothetical protein